MKKEVYTDAVPSVPMFSQAVDMGNLVFVSGQLAKDPPEDFRTEVTQVMDQLGEILQAAGLGYQDVVKVTVFLTDMSLFKQMNEVYMKYFPEGVKPSRSCVGVCGLAKKRARVEIDLIAAR
jgi:2-iminobutanoate/2-iminopropanoate deaminase